MCGNCFTSIPLQRQAEIKGGNALIVCETCGVILHADR
ncbi:MAG: C4-type zinc ribbon domain-containing protein [Gemmatimonadota bacterium]